MPTVELAIAAGVVVGIFLLWKFVPCAVARIVTAILLLPILLFCCFGFAGTFEPMDRWLQITGRVVYLVVALSCLAGIVWLALPRTRNH
jgi:hypothetical protein